jgi:tetratricopeptide (TPR) repeat protein
MKKLFALFIAVLLLFQFACKNSAPENSINEINQQGIEFMNAGKYDSALLSFFKAIEIPGIPKDSKGTIYRNIALTYKEMSKPDSTIHFSTLAAKCYAKSSFNYLVNTADVDLAKGKIAVALTKLNKAVNIYPNEMIVNNTLGLIYMGEYDESFTNLDKALRYNSKAFELNGGRVTEDLLARTFYKMENYEKAELHFEHLLENYPDMISYPLNTGMIKFKLKKIAEADELFDKVLLLDSSYKETIDVFKTNNR